MPSGDGLIVRLRLTGGVVGVALAKQIAVWSSRWGNGQIDLSNRANLQLRGFSARHLAALHDALAAIGMLDDSEAGEAVRNVVSSPLAGLDPSALLDVGPIVRDLERRLAGDRLLHALPGKFGFAVDDGGMFPLDDLPVDVGFVACPGPEFAIYLAGAPLEAVGWCDADAVGEAAAGLAGVFLRPGGVRRMRDLVATRGAWAVARDAGLRAVGSGGRVRTGQIVLGAHACGDAGFLGVGLPFGRVSASDLADLAVAAGDFGVEELRLTPWRAILVPVPSVAATRALAVRLPAGAFILDADDPRRRVACCPGAPACERATTPVREDASLLAAIVGVNGSGIAVHVSGCEKGCAYPRAAAVTLVGRQGRYDLVRGGLASGLPAMTGLTLAQAAEQVR
jgi:precorrin-3B synthase